MIIASSFTVTPPIKKSYGYKQTSIPGVVPANTEEITDIQSKKIKRKQSYNYWFYLEMPKTEEINITGLWISGNAYDIKQETITVLPVKKYVFNGPASNDTIILVPATKNKVMLIYPLAESKNTSISSKVKSLSTANELVIGYTWKNKKYYTTIKKLKEIDPDVRP